MVCFLLTSCTPATREKWQRKTDRRSPAQLLNAALHDTRADERRRAVELLADGAEGKSKAAVEAYDSIARLDTDAMVRSAAVRAMGRCADTRCVSTLVKLLESGDRPIEDTRPAPAAVRWEATLLLQRYSAEAAVATQDRETVLSAVLKRVEHDPDRNVRLSAIAALQHYPDRRTLPVVINVLRTRDFALQLRAEDTLHELTGQSHDQDADAWEGWLARTTDPFAGVTRKPAERGSWWSRMFGGAK